jgi:hypothetical protein
LAENIDTYLRELRSALGTADTALVQDALYDAEEHLQAELADIRERYKDQPGQLEHEFALMIERYGSPEEVAGAYLASDAGKSDGAGRDDLGGDLVPTAEPGDSLGASPPAPPVGRGFWRWFFGVAADPATYRALLYMLLSLATGTIFFTVVVTGISTTAGLLVLIVGIPFALGFLAVVRALSLAEGRIVEALLGTRMPRRSRTEPRGVGFWGRIRFWLKDRRTWTAMLYMILQLPLGTAYFSLAVCGLAAGAWLVVLPFMQVIGGHTYLDIGGAEHLFSSWALFLMVIAGVVVLVLMLHLIRLIGRAHGNYAKAMLVRLD